MHALPNVIGKFFRSSAFSLFAVAFTLLANYAYAQPQADTADKIKIIIANTGAIEHFTTDSGSFNKFVHDVVVYQGTDTLYCDSLYQFIEKKKLEAYGNVRIAQQGGTQGTSKFLRYSSDKRLAFMTGDVQLTDGQNKLWTQELTYDLGTKTGTFNRNGTLRSDSTIVTSIYGIYNVRSHEARFTGNVVVLDPQYKIASKDLGYNTETRVETFYDYSVVTSDSGRSVLTAYKGTYDSKNVVARFAGHSSIWSDGQYIEADSMHYDKNSGYGFAIGNVISIDTTQHATIYCGRIDYFRKRRVLWAIIKPVLELANGPDTFYMRADTFYSAPMIRVKGKQFRMPEDTTEKATDTTLIKPIPKTAFGKDSIATIKKPTIDSPVVKKGSRTRPIRKPVKTDTVAVDTSLVNAVPDSMWAVPPIKYRVADLLKDTARRIVAAKPPKGKRKDKAPPIPTALDTTTADTTSPIFFTGYHHVRIFSDSMQAKCDSVCYTRADSIVRMMYDPVTWARRSQVTGDTILILMDSGGARSMFIPNSGFVVARSGPDKANLFDQIQGESITAYFKENAIRKMIVNPDAQTIYYSKDDDGAYVGVNEATSVLMRIFFGEQNISRIKFEQDVHQKVTPMDQADLPNLRLPRFKWRYEERPKSKEELFE